MIFNCEHCESVVSIDHYGDFTGCDHYPVSRLMVLNNRKADRWLEISGEMRKSSCFSNVSKISRVKERKILLNIGVIESKNWNPLIEPKNGKRGYIRPTIRTSIL